MPGKGHLPDLQERILRGLKANTNRTAGGLGSNASPGMTRDRIAAMRRGAPASGTTAARSSKVDAFSIADDSDSSFTLTYAPIVDSWNLELNGVRVHGAEFSISGKTLSIVDATDLFLGADTQGSPWDLEIQYDYLTGSPGTPPANGVVGHMEYAGGAFNTHDFTLPDGVDAGDFVVFTGFASNGARLTAGWTDIDKQQQDVGDPTIWYSWTIGLFLTTEEPGDILTLSANVLGSFLTGWVGTIVRGVDPVTPVGDISIGYGTDPGSITGTGNNICVYHVVAHDGGVDPLTLDRGTAIVNGSGSDSGHTGVYASSSEADLNATVTVHANSTFAAYIVTMVLNRA